MKVPVVGGKVSFYNETLKGPIKPSPVLGAIGLIEEKRLITESSFKHGDSIFIIGTTADEPGGSEYSSIDNLLFSESHSRFIIGTHEPKKVEKILSGIGGLVYSQIGEVYDQNVAFNMNGKILIDTDIQTLAANFRKLEHIMTR
jgi:phosphoribosylformylglycinamidine (FGAM) synthase-like enzyme